MLISRQRINEAVHYIPEKKLVYLNNAKVACSTLKKSIWLWADHASFSRIDNPHDRQFAPFCKSLNAIAGDLDRFMGSTFFSVVRNPYVRILSAYLDKVARRPRDARVWQPFARRFRMSADAAPSFQEFLRFVASEDPYLLDQHFAPQFINILSDFSNLDFIGHIEDFGAVKIYLSNLGIQVVSHTPHPTNAVDNVNKFYGKKEQEIVLSIYEKDFEKFGYSEDINIIEPIETIKNNLQDREILGELIKLYTNNNKESRVRHISGLTQKAPKLLIEFNALESGSLSVQEIRALGDRAIRGELENWRLIARIGQELIAHDMIFEAAQILWQAKRLMYGKL